ncbi:hypothetical protein QU481_23060 [Crenobacter sp. SG2303]|uniref:IS6 family transposase n=1 Tax=Crenobacter oryzisoli TaxID=3056844 RepID=A0ABT7XVD4_9NEIS|nr:hypothetical protein [Crenobacter sp. SG2303]MDN0077695.1 hypothetical protein [Crenobacter sp. SG2303]
MKKTPVPAWRKALKRLHFPIDVILLCVRWYLAYSLSLRNLEEMMVERGAEMVGRRSPSSSAILA